MIPIVPSRFLCDSTAGMQIEKTELLNRMVETWGEIPIGFIQHMGIHKNLYGYIGTEDRSLYPLIRPGAIVVIDDRDTKIQTKGWKDDFDRPIYFLQLRDGYACGWCQVNGGKLSVIPYSSSKDPIRYYDYPQDVDVIGRVIGVAMTFGDPQSRPSLKSGDSSETTPPERGRSKPGPLKLLETSLPIDLKEMS